MTRGTPMTQETTISSAKISAIALFYSVVYSSLLLSSSFVHNGGFSGTEFLVAAEPAEPPRDFVHRHRTIHHLLDEGNLADESKKSWRRAMNGGGNGGKPRTKTLTIFDAKVYL